MTEIKRWATFSACRQYRYSLRRAWDDSKPKLVLVMMNPSTADEHDDDPTTTFCIRHVARRYEKYGRYEAVNLYPIVGSDPEIIKECPIHVHQRNERRIMHAASSADSIIVAWGKAGQHDSRAFRVAHMLRHHDLYCFGKNKDGSPRFPRALKKDVPVVLWREGVAA